MFLLQSQRNCCFCKLRTGSFHVAKTFLRSPFSTRAPICHGVFTTRTGLCLGKLNFRALFHTDMEASLRNEPIKLKYKIRQSKIKSHLKVKNTIFDIFQDFWFCWLLCGTKKIFYIRFKNVLKINWLVKTPWQDYIAWNLLAPVSKNGLVVRDIKFT